MAKDPTADKALIERAKLEALERQFIAAKESKAGVTREQKLKVSEARRVYRTRFRPFAPTGIIVAPDTVIAAAKAVKL